MTSSFTEGGAGDNCVEVALSTEAVLIRDSKAPDGGRLAVSAASWVLFTRMARGV